MVDRSWRVHQPLPRTNSLNVALAHHWVVRMRGGERVLEQLCLLFEAAPIYTLVARKGTTSALIDPPSILQSRLNRLPFAVTHYRQMLPLFTWGAGTRTEEGR